MGRVLTDFLEAEVVPSVDEKRDRGGNFGGEQQEPRSGVGIVHVSYRQARVTGETGKGVPPAFTSPRCLLPGRSGRERELWVRAPEITHLCHLSLPVTL